MGSTIVRATGTNFCLDAGSGTSRRNLVSNSVIVDPWPYDVAPANGVGMKIWQCYTGLAAQQWTFTTDNHIALQSNGT